MPRSATIEQQVAALTKRVTLLESERPGRKSKPLLVLKERGVCAINPEMDSMMCLDASIYRYQSGCWGDACRYKQHQAYKRRKRFQREVEAVPVRRRVTKKTTKPAAKTAKVAVKPVTKRRVTKKAS